MFSIEQAIKASGPTSLTEQFIDDLIKVSSDAHIRRLVLSVSDFSVDEELAGKYRDGGYSVRNMGTYWLFSW
jgi:hypothetical protein